ncbi:MAG: tRNA (guanosine(37)-N1)-methyltransferase TrmD [Pseudomonadota bacterium]
MTERPNKSHGRLAISASLKPRALMEDRPRLADAFRAKVLTLYPEMFPGPLGASLIGTALKDGLWHLETVDIRQFGLGKHRQVDDTPTGGGAGMVMKPDVLDKVIRYAQRDTFGPWPLIYLTPRGRPITQSLVSQLAQGPGMTLLCGRFEGIDERIIQKHQMLEVSLGDFVMTGGEIAAQALLDATVRLIPRVLGNAGSIEDESFSNGLLEYPHYTRPNDWNGMTVPEVLLSGHHQRIAEWRRDQSERLTKERRPDLWRAYAEGHTDPVEDQQLSDAHTIAAKGEHKD